MQMLHSFIQTSLCLLLVANGGLTLPQGTFLTDRTASSYSLLKRDSEHTDFPWTSHPDSFYDPVCDTSDMSPFLNDTLAALEILRLKDHEHCRKSSIPSLWKNGESDCKTLVEHRSAAVALCSGLYHAHLHCQSVADKAKEVALKCVNNDTGKTGGLVEGYNTEVRQNTEFRVVVFRKEGFYDLTTVASGCHTYNWWDDKPCREWMTLKLEEIFPPGTKTAEARKSPMFR